jgi:hypothetical protein
VGAEGAEEAHVDPAGVHLRDELLGVQSARARADEVFYEVRKHDGSEMLRCCSQAGVVVGGVVCAKRGEGVGAERLRRLGHELWAEQPRQVRARRAQ